MATRPPCRYCQGLHVSHLCPLRRSEFRRFTTEVRPLTPGTDPVVCVYGWGKYPRYSVLAGQDRKVFLDSFETVPEALSFYPKAKPSSVWIERPNTFNHLPGEDL